MDADKAAQQDDDDANQWERYPWAATAQQLRTHQFRYESSSDESDGDTIDEEAGAEEAKAEPLELGPLPDAPAIAAPPAKTDDEHLSDFVDALQKKQLGRVCRLRVRARLPKRRREAAGAEQACWRLAGGRLPSTKGGLRVRADERMRPAGVGHARGHWL